MATTPWHRIVDAARQSLTLEGLVAALVGGGVWAVAAGVLAQATSVRIGPAIAVGAGFGLVAAAAFIWLFVRPDRDRRQERTDLLKSSVRKHLFELAPEGYGDWEQTIDPGAAIDAWRRDVESLLLEAFGREAAAKVMALETTDEQADALDELRRSLDDIRLRPGYRGWGRY